MTDIGPIQLLAFGFGAEAEYQGQILTELERFEGRGMIRVLDVLFVGRDADARQLIALNHQGDKRGRLVGAVLGLTGTPPAHAAIRGAHVGHESVGLTRDVLQRILTRAPPDMAIGLLLIEHVWARNFKIAIREAGGVPLIESFLSDRVVGEIADRLEEAVRVLDDLECSDNWAPVGAGSNAAAESC
jgi:hypothetical protein